MIFNKKVREVAVYSDGVNNGDFNAGYTYDENGNISTLSRKANGNPIDVLTYSYFNGGNKLNTVTDAGTTEGYHAVGGTYLYDVNGNMVTDPSKGTTIEYNYLNLPKNVEFGANDNLRYTYDAAGNKLVKVVDGTVAGNNTRLDYSGNFLYENNELKAIFTSVGRIIPFDNNGEIVYKFEYSLKDHFGNTRVVFCGHSNGQPEVMQITDYYPFGMVMNQENYFADAVLSNKYLYNNKELQDDELAGNKLDWYDYGARFYDPELGRWHVVDPLAESYYPQSSYHFSGNNPVKFVDLDGMRYDWVEQKDGFIYWDEDAISQATTKQGEKYLGKNVIVATHNRDESLHEPINSATFDLYLESDKTGPSASIDGNTVPAKVNKFGTLAEGIYPARFQGRASKLAKDIDDLAIIINEGKDLPTVKGNPNKLNSSMIDQIFLHAGNYAQKRLTYMTKDGNIDFISEGCQTTGCGPGTRPLHTAFMLKAGRNFEGFYYLRSNPEFKVP